MPMVFYYVSEQNVDLINKFNFSKWGVKTIVIMPSKINSFVNFCPFISILSVP